MDSRYPGFASIMEDGRILTDYRAHCATNVGIPRQFLQHNADALIQISRKRQGERLGAQYSKAGTVVGPAIYQKCDATECSFRDSKDAFGVGIEQSTDTSRYSLFGTFFNSAQRNTAPTGRVPLTTVFEGGRNSRRG